MIYVITFIFGLIFGSFFNVCIYRIPRGESIVFPASHCPNCHYSLHPWENIPVVSFIALRARCRSCQAPISWRYPFVELLTASLFVMVIYTFSVSIGTLFYLIFVAALIIISFIDLDYQIIPDKISLPGIGVGLIASFFLPISWHASLLGAIIGGGVIWVTGYLGELVFKKEAMGGGDVKLMAMIGAFIGWKLTLLTIFFASLIGAVIGILSKLMTGKEYIPFGPFLSAGALLALFVGRDLLNWYWSLVMPAP